jgi:hypothetical protein
MKISSVAFFCCIALAGMLTYAQSADEGFQMARVVSIERVPADAQHMENSDRYKISMRLGDTVYACHASASPAVFIDWSTGKEFPAKLNGKTMLVKGPNGQIVELNVAGKKTAK